MMMMMMMMMMTKATLRLIHLPDNAVSCCDRPLPADGGRTAVMFTFDLQ